jgi:hypothetical protein
MLNVECDISRHDETMWVMANDPCACRLLLGRNHDFILVVLPATAPSFLIQLPILQLSAVFQGVHGTSSVLVYIAVQLSFLCLSSCHQSHLTHITCYCTF